MEIDEQEPTEPSDPGEGEAEPIIATLTEGIGDGDVVALYYDNESLALSTTASGAKLTGISVTPENDMFEVIEGVAKLTVSVDENGYYSFICDGKYLTSASTGNGISFTDTLEPYSLWQVETTDSGLHIINVNAKYNSSNQYLENYKGNFTTYTYKSANDSLYIYHFYKISSGAPGDTGLVIDDSISFEIAQWAGNADYSAISNNQIFGDRYHTNDMLDENATYYAVVSGNRITPFTSSTSNGSTTYYMGGVGLGTGTDDYLQFATSSKGFGDMSLSLRLRASNTGPGSFQLQYSLDGTSFTNLTTGTYSYSYTSYNSAGESYNVSDAGDIADGIAKTSFAPGKYVEFTFDIPNEAANAEFMYIRMIPGAEAAKTGSTLGTRGTLRVDSVVVKGSPILSSTICGYVSALPSEGEVGFGQELTLASATSGATLYYSYDGATFAAYDATDKPAIMTLPANITVYATKTGLQDSIKTIYQYTQAQCDIVKATPNGGSVSLNSKVRLKDDTEGATILYALATEGQDDETLIWQNYDNNLVLKELPVTIKAKAVKDGYLDSAISTFVFSEKLNDRYLIFFGQIHSHTNYSDGAGTVEDAFSYATQVDNLDFLAVTDHSNMLDNESQSVLAKNVDTSETDEWSQGHILADLYSSDEFTCLYGFEMTWSNGLGHINTFDTAGFQSRTQSDYATYSTALQNYYSALATVPDSISQFNHPGTTFGDFNDFGYYSKETDDLITLIEVGNGEGTIGSSGYFPSYEYYTRALDKGWHVAPSNNQDNHKGKWGDANTARTVVLADSNTEENIYDAMRNYRVYATEDNNLDIYYTLDDFIMGSILDLDQVEDKVTIKAEIQDDDTSDTIGKVEVIVNGGLSIASKTITSNKEDVVFEVPATYSYYYIKVTEGDGDIAVTAPVWVGEVESCGINSISTTTSVPVQSEAVDVNLDLYNNEEFALNIDSIDFTVDDVIIKSVSGEELLNSNIASIASAGKGTYSFDYVYDDAGYVTIDVLVNATLNGVAKVYKDSLTLSYVQPEMVTHVLIDGTHYNDYVTGYYGGNMSSFIDICSTKNIIAKIETNEITEDELEDCELLLISAPAKKSGTANTGDFTPSTYSDDFISMVTDYVKSGGSVILCGIADYQDSTSVRTSEQMNKLLEAIGSNVTLYSDEVYDEVKNGGQPYRLYFENFNMESDYLSGVVAGQRYSMYSGCSVNLTGATENDSVYAAIPLVYGFDSTYSIDSKDATGGYLSAPYNTVVEKGAVVALAQQTTKAGGNIFVAGSIFMSDFEIDAVMDNSTSLQYANYNIVCNILDTITKKLPVSTIAEARKGELGDTFAVEGYVTNGTQNPDTTFFDTIYIQDATGGIDIFPFAETGLAIGAKIHIVGYVAEYQGDVELKVISYEILEDEPVIIEPTVLSTKDAMDYITYGGSLIQTSGVVTKVKPALDEAGISEFWIKDASGKEAAIFIDGYIYSGTTGKNELASLVKVGENITAIGILYMHPEDDADASVPVLRVRNCDEITVKAATNTNHTSGGTSQTPTTTEDSANTAENTTSGTTRTTPATNGEVANEEETDLADAGDEEEGTIILPEDVPASAEQSIIVPEDIPLAAGEQLNQETHGKTFIYIVIIIAAFGMLVGIWMYVRRRNLLEKK